MSAFSPSNNLTALKRYGAKRIKVVLADSENDIVVKVSDQGGGFNRKGDAFMNCLNFARFVGRFCTLFLIYFYIFAFCGLCVCVLKICFKQS